MNLEGSVLVIGGGEVKALDDAGRVGGHIVLFGGPEAADLSETRDYFTADTDFDFEDGAKTTALYHHGLVEPIKGRKLGRLEMRRDDAGIWAEGQLALRDDYERKIFELAKNGKLGWSTGTAAHLVERKAIGEGVHEVTRWPLGLDASLTPTPCDYRTRAVSLATLPAMKALTPLMPPDARRAVDGLSRAIREFSDFRAALLSDPDAWRDEVKAFSDELAGLLAALGPDPAAVRAAEMAEAALKRQAALQIELARSLGVPV